MDKKKEPPRLQDLAYTQICKMIREVGIKWTRRLHSAAVMGQNYWLREIEAVEGECVTVRHRLASQPVEIFTDDIIRYAVKGFSRIIASYDNDIVPALITKLHDRQIHRDICANMLKAVLLPCISRCNIGNTESEFVQELLIKLLYVIPNLKALIMPSKERLNYVELVVERIPILTHLQKFRFHVGCTREIIFALSKYCPHMRELSVQDSILVDDICVEHLLKLRHLHSLNVSNTSMSNHIYKLLLAGLPHVQDVTWHDPIDPVLSNLTKRLPLVRKFVGTVSSARLLAQKCPKINKLVLHSLTDDISDLGELRRVASISIRNCSYDVIRFSDALIRLGQTLSILEIHEVENVNIGDLIKYCTVLNELNISCCNVTCTGIFDRIFPHFVNLKELRLRQNRGPFVFSSILHLYINLKVLHVVGMGDITDKVIRPIVMAGRFRNVTEFVAEHCGYMGIETAFFIMRNCPNLTKLGNLNSWLGVANGELVSLVNFVRKNNFSLTVCR
jgi:hypothetical protein